MTEEQRGDLKIAQKLADRRIAREEAERTREAESRNQEQQSVRMKEQDKWANARKTMAEKYGEDSYTFQFWKNNLPEGVNV